MSTEQLSVEPIAQPKVWRTTESTYLGMVLGACDSFRMLQLIRYGFNYPIFVEGENDPLEYMVREFVPALRQLIEKAGIPADEDGPYLHGNLMVGFAGRLFVVQGDLAVTENTHGYAAIGAGAPYALGSLCDMSSRATSGRILLGALSAAATHCFAVRDPFDLVSTAHG